MPRWVKGEFPIHDGVLVGREALDREALDAFKRGDFPSKRQTADAFLARYFGEGVRRLTADQQESKVKYIARRLTALEQRG